jgi:hypothetical protein
MTNRLLLRWILFTSAGETLGFSVPGVVGASAFALGLSDLELVPPATLAGTLEGAILGAAQARALRPFFPALRAGDWMRATSLGGVFAWALGMLLGAYSEQLADRSLVLLAVIWCLAGVAILNAIGLAQWLVLRRHLNRAWLWLPANALAWLLGLAWVFGAMALVSEDSPAWQVGAVSAGAGLLMAGTVAVVTGLALVRILRPGLRL